MFPSRAEIKNYNVLIDGRNFDDQPINDLIKQYDKVRKAVLERAMIIPQDVYLIMLIQMIIRY